MTDVSRSADTSKDTTAVDDDVIDLLAQLLTATMLRRYDVAAECCRSVLSRQPDLQTVEELNLLVGRIIAEEVDEVEVEESEEKNSEEESDEGDDDESSDEEQEESSGESEADL